MAPFIELFAKQHYFRVRIDKSQKYSFARRLVNRKACPVYLVTFFPDSISLARPFKPHHQLLMALEGMHMIKKIAIIGGGPAGSTCAKCVEQWLSEITSD